MRILVLQTTRMGDVLQTSPLIRALRYKYPGAHIAVMVRRMGKTIAERNPDINQVLIYDEDSIFLDLRSQDSDRLYRAYTDTQVYVQAIRAGQYDVAYNCSHSIASAMLLTLAEIPTVVGAHLSNDWQFVLRGPWTNYFFTSVFAREYNDLNLCDITRRFEPEAVGEPGLVFDVRDEDRAFVNDLLASNGVGPDDFVACFQLGASEENKRWSEGHFARLGRLLVERKKARIFLLGVKEEEPLGKVFEEQAPGLAVHLYGKTTIPQVAALLERSRLLVSNDTGTMHIAAAVNCPLVLVSVGHVHFRETGPYGEGHCAIEYKRPSLGRADGVPGGLDERTLILPEQVYRAVELTIDRARAGRIEQAAPQPGFDTVEMHMTRFAPDGCLQWYPVLRRPVAEPDFIRIAYRLMWLDYLGAQRDPEVERVSLADLAGYYESPGAGVVALWRDTLAATFTELAAMAETGIQETNRLIECLQRPGKARQAQEIVRKLTALDERMRLFGELNPPCRPLALISRFERDNLEGADPAILSQRTLQIYQDCRDRAMLFAQKAALAAKCFA
ncbi:MAG: glycosyltransferase family 9 protein [Candidatus Hydrogenedentes bacterium]|nr:glycosyltransferase family 9 protein [Candidatus Hydrogenedentota bacterium]